MRLPGEDEYHDRGRSMPVVYAIAGVSVVVLLILIIVINSNRDSGRNSGSNIRPPVQEQGDGFEADIDEGERNIGSGEGLRVDDLDFWEMYPERGDDFYLTNEAVEPEDPVEEASPAPLDPSEDGRHTLVERRNGTSEWVRINPYITKNNYDPLGFILRNDRMGYFENDRPVSNIGIDVSPQNGRVDFRRVKNNGIDFVMLRLGARGYETGNVSVDDNFAENLDAALESELNVGVYFFSQAISVEEVTEEAILVIESLAGKNITYPVVFNMSHIAFDSSRIDRLTRAEKTEIADTFCNYLIGAGYVPMIYGTKEWLIEQIDLTKLMDYDIWLSQVGSLPDYPYKFQMWQYSHVGSVAGVNGFVNMNICFVDYTAR